MPWLARVRPDLVERYDELYGARNGYLARDEQERISALVRGFVAAARRLREEPARVARLALVERTAPAGAGRAARAVAARRLTVRWLGCGGMPLQNRVTPFSELVAASGARPALRQPRLHARRERAHPAALRHAALDRVPARVPRLAARAEAAARALHRAVLPRRGRRRSPPATAPARSAAAPTTCGSARSGASCTPARSAPTRSTCSCTASASRPTTRAQRHHARAARRPPRRRRSSCATARPGSCSDRGCCAGRPRATPSGCRGRAAATRPSSRRRRWSPCCAPAGQPLVPLLHPSV